MIAVELARVVADEPVMPPGAHARVSSQPTALEVGTWGVERIIYLPQLALVIVSYHDHLSCIIPVEHVWHMSVAERQDTLGLLAEALG